MHEDFGRGRRPSRDLNMRPIDYWRKFITDDMLDAIVVATKRRVQERIAGGATSWYAMQKDLASKIGHRERSHRSRRNQ